MTTFQLAALLLTAVWLVLVVVHFRRSTVALIAGLLVIGAYTLAALLLRQVTPTQLGLGQPGSWLITVGWAVLGLGLVLVYSPLADRLASRWFKQPPTLETFRVIQQSKAKLITGILTAWALGGILEELVARGIVLGAVASLLKDWLGGPAAAGVAVFVAALGAGALHSYQGPRAVIIITQLSILFGILFVVCGHNLWAVILCHGLYDTIAFVRFALKKSKYSNPKG
jgi:membrane protease YdiL (CAAX protease family)